VAEAGGEGVVGDDGKDVGEDDGEDVEDGSDEHEGEGVFTEGESGGGDEEGVEDEEDEDDHEGDDEHGKQSAYEAAKGDALNGVGLHFRLSGYGVVDRGLSLRSCMGSGGCG
jgi:hypothetical protein